MSGGGGRAETPVHHVKRFALDSLYSTGRQRDGLLDGLLVQSKPALCDVRWKFSVYDCFARGVSRVRTSCTAPRLQVRPLASLNEDLNSLNSSLFFFFVFLLLSSSFFVSFEVAGRG